MKRIMTALLATATGGVLAGLLLGLTEATALAVLGNGWGNFSTLFWAVAVYGSFGLLGGLGLGLVGSLILGKWLPRHANWWLLVGGAAIYSGVGLIVIRFRLVRDLFQQRESLFSPASLTLHAILLLVFGGVFVAAWLIARRWAKPTPVVVAESATPLAPVTPAAPTLAPAEDDDSLSRRTFLKGALAAGVLALPVTAAASQWVSASGPRLTAIHRTGLPQTLKNKPNIIFIVVDTLRADHLGVHGYHKPLTPQIDAFAGQSIRFAHNFAQASWTKPCMATLLTSLYPSSHNAIYKSSALPNGVITLPEVLQAGGYVTGGFGNNINLAPIFNFGKGFSDYHFLAPDYLFGASEAASQTTAYQTLRMLNNRFLDSRKNVHNFYQPADVVTERAMDWIQQHEDDRFFLFLHYMDPHDPYFEHPFDGYGIARVSMPNPAPEMAPELHRLYEGEIAYTDEYVGKLFDWLKQQGMYDDTLIVFTADHGEEFYEHGGWWHGLTLYDEQIHVPLIFKMPGQAQAGTVDTALARSLDIAPTIIRQAGFDVPEVMQGLDLIGETARPELVYSEEDHEGNILRSMRGAQWKLMEANAANPRGLEPLSLFHVAEDPQEMQNLGRTETAKVAELQAHLDQVSSMAIAQAVVGSEQELDPETLQLLKKSGY